LHARQIAWEFDETELLANKQHCTRNTPQTAMEFDEIELQAKQAMPV
jgi:hypothetical protein